MFGRAIIENQPCEPQHGLVGPLVRARHDWPWLANAHLGFRESLFNPKFVGYLRQIVRGITPPSVAGDYARAAVGDGSCHGAKHSLVYSFKKISGAFVEVEDHFRRVCLAPLIVSGFHS